MITASQPLSESDKDRLLSSIAGIFLRYKHAYQFPVEQEHFVDVLRANWPEDLREGVEAIEKIEAAEPMLGRSTSLPLLIPVEGAESVVSFRVDLKFATPIMGFHTYNPSPQDWRYALIKNCQYYDSLITWAQHTYDLKQRTISANALITDVISKCNTTGQIHRVWPELTKYFPDSYIMALKDSVRKSRLPKGLDTTTLEGKPQATAVLAMLSMLPPNSTVSVYVY